MFTAVRAVVVVVAARARDGIAVRAGIAVRPDVDVAVVRVGMAVRATVDVAVRAVVATGRD